MQKAGIVTIIGRPNVGKSTLVNNLIGRKVAITSPKPQTTRFPLQAVYEDERGQIVFVDTPGVFIKNHDLLSKSINSRTEQALGQDTDLVLYIIDPTRSRDSEENRTLGMARKINAPKILVVNKSDVKKPDYSAEFAFYEDEFDKTIKVSALKHANLNLLLDAIFEYLPEGKPLIESAQLVHPAINMDSKLFVSEIIREKVFLIMREEVPYTVQVEVDQIEERNNGTLYIQARIITLDDTYKKMLIGKDGSMIKELGSLARKEFEVATAKKVYLDLTVEVNPHWQEAF